MAQKLSLLRFIVLFFCLITPSHANAWEWLKSSNKYVDEGNQKLKANDHKGALEAYDQAARQLPSKGGVHLNRGLALLKGGDLNQSRQALLVATEPPASPEIRADAYYNLGISFYQEADTKATEQNHQDAQRLFREAADTLKRSLRLSPRNRDAAWNLELALRRIREEEKKQQEKEQQEKEQQEKEQQEKEHQEKEEQQPETDQKKNDKEPQQKPEDEQKSQDKKQNPQPNKSPKSEPEKKKPQEKPQQKDSQEPPSTQPQTESPPPPLPKDAERTLDALQKGEENLERHRARIRAAREGRQPEKDW